jgi:hypothetical protein
MTTDLFLNSIKEWFDEYEHQLREIVAEVDEERRYLIESEKTLEPNLLEYSNQNYVIACVEEPIRKILRFIKENRKCQVLDDKISGEFLAEIEDIVLFLKVLPIEYRKMLLKGFDGAIRDNPTVLEGVLQANLDKLMEAAQRFDLSAVFTQIGFFIAFAQKYGTKSEQRLQLAEDILTIKYINNGFTEIRKFFLLDKEREAGKPIRPWLEEFCKCYREMTYCFTYQEKAMINRLLQDEHFKVISRKMGVDVELIINGGSLDATEVSTLTLDSNENVSQEPLPEQLSAADYNQETITVDPNLTDRDYETFAYPLLQGKKKGRHRGKWYDTKYYNAAEDELGDSIKRDVWPLIREHLGEFKYPDSVAGESKRTIMKNLGAALIYYAAQGTIPPIAKDWNAQGVKSSYERTFKRIEVVARNSVDAFMTMLEKYEEVEPLLESDQKNKAALKLSVLLKNYGDEQKKYILSHNLYEIKGLIEYLRDRLPVIFKPYCKDK